MKFKGRKEKIFNVPNSLSLSRIASVPLIVLFLLFPNKLTNFLAAITFSVASLTDLLDGFFARRRRTVTTIGRLLDPMADKLLISAALIMLIPLDRVPAWMVFLIIGREIAITGLRGIGSSKGIIINVSSLGKYKTSFQIVATIGLLLHYPYLGVDFHKIGMFLLWIALILTLWSGMVYFTQFYKILSEGEEE